MFGIRRACFGGYTSLRNSLTSYELRCLLTLRGFSRTPEDGWVDDFNKEWRTGMKELETVFGRPPESPSQWGGHVASENLNVGVSENPYEPSSVPSTMDGGLFRVDTLTHVDDSGKAAMVNVTEKAETKRVAVASGRVLLGPMALQLVAKNNISKGDVLTVAKIAGIQGAKQTSNLIPLCHNVLLSGVDVSLSLNEALHAVDIRAEATSSGRTGVEMEALTAVSVASLTVYDMCKAVSKNIEIGNVQLESNCQNFLCRKKSHRDRSAQVFSTPSGSIQASQGLTRFETQDLRPTLTQTEPSKDVPALKPATTKSTVHAAPASRRAKRRGTAISEQQFNNSRLCSSSTLNLVWTSTSGRACSACPSKDSTMSAS